MTTEPTLCPKCERRPSERIGIIYKADPPGSVCRKETHESCPDPIHDLADLAPEMAEDLERLRSLTPDIVNQQDEVEVPALRAALQEMRNALEQIEESMQDMLRLDDTTSNKNDELLARIGLSDSGDAPWCAAILNAREAVVAADAALDRAESLAPERKDTGDA